MCHLQVGRPAPQLNFGLSSSAFKLIFTHKLLSNLEPKTSPSLMGRWDRGWEQGRTGAAGAEMVMVPPASLPTFWGQGNPAHCPAPSWPCRSEFKPLFSQFPSPAGTLGTVAACGMVQRWRSSDGLGGEGSISWGLGWVYWGFFSSGCGTSTLRQV